MIPKTWFSAPLSKSAKDTESRIRNIFQGQHRRPAVLVLALATAAVLLCGSMVAIRERGADKAARSVRWSAERQDITRIELWAQGETVGLTDATEIGRLLDAVEQIEFFPAAEDAVSVPGAVYLALTAYHKDGTEKRVTFPVWEKDGACWETGGDWLGEFQPYFREPDGSGDPVAEETTAETPRELLLHALRGELAFPLDISHTRSYVLPEREFTLSELTEEDTETMERAAYTFLDLNGDGTEEAVYRRGDYLGFFILRVWEGRVYGYELNYRGMLSLKQDGTFAQSSGAEDNGYGRVVFQSAELALQDFMWRRGETCTIENKTVDRDEYYRAMAAQDAKPDAVWQEFAPKTAQSLHEIRLSCSWEDVRAASEPAEQWTMPTERQSVPKGETGELLADHTLPNGKRVVLFRTADDPDTKDWAIDRGDAWEVFCTENSAYSEGYSVSTYENVLGHDGFRIHGPRGAGYYFGDYYYFDENGAVCFLADGSNQVLEADLNGDGTKEVLYLYHYWAACEFLADGTVYSCYLPGLIDEIDGWSWHDNDVRRDPETQVIEKQILPITLHLTKDQNVTRDAELRFSADGIALSSEAD